MKRTPRLLRGEGQIADYLGISPRAVVHRHRQRQLPTMVMGGVVCATKAALADWKQLYREDKIPR